MTQEDKQLLLKDLSTRLPYGVMVRVEYTENGESSVDEGTLNGFAYEEMLNSSDIVSSIKPYLRPMSSMTEEEINEYHKLEFIHVNYGLEPLQCVLSVNEIDWLNAHHFDYRGLIDKGLAIEVTEENNPYKK